MEGEDPVLALGLLCDGTQNSFYAVRERFCKDFDLDALYAFFFMNFWIDASLSEDSTILLSCMGHCLTKSSVLLRVSCCACTCVWVCVCVPLCNGDRGWREWFWHRCWSDRWEGQRASTLPTAQSCLSVELQPLTPPEGPSSSKDYLLLYLHKRDTCGILRGLPWSKNAQLCHCSWPRRGRFTET